MDKLILDAAFESEPELMHKVAESLQEIEQTAPEFMDDVFQEFELISAMTLEKCATVPPSIRDRAIEYGKDTAKLVGIAGAAALGTSIAAELFDISKRGLTKARNFKRIMKYAPGLKNEISDPARIKPAYDALHRYAPDFTADPMLGASLLKSLANQPPGNEHVLITSLLNSRKTLGEIKNNQYKPDFRPKDKKDTFEQRRELEGAKKPPIEYHQHFHGSKGSKPIALKNPGATPTND